ncbi:UbiA family prenyltransferase [Streptomyces sp. NPDC021098]|uniref:UbiA family prenyltransferase n=1 Tax=unclassified Streptomyces TaxID=2593676 RepID=UPI00379E05C5
MTVSGALATGCGAHLQTWRPYTLSYPGLVGLAGAALADGSPSAAHLWAAWAAPTLSWIAGHYLGDYFDRDLDATAKPQRPIPSGRLSPRAAVASGVLCALAAAVVTALAAWTALLLVAAGMAGIVAYSKVFKGRGLSGNAVRGALTALTVVFGALTAGTEPRWPAVLLAALAFWAHDTASNLVGTLRDVEGDRGGGYRTLPVLRGVRYAARTAALLYAAAIVTAAVCVPLTAPGGRTAFAALLLAAAACGVGAFAPLLRGAAPLTPVRALRAHEILVAERLILAGAVLSGGWGPTPALTLLTPLLALSVLTQRRMRARHEFPPEGAEPTAHPLPDRAPTTVPRVGRPPEPGPLRRVAPGPDQRAEPHADPHAQPPPRQDRRSGGGPDQRAARHPDRHPEPPPRAEPHPDRHAPPPPRPGPAPSAGAAGAAGGPRPRERSAAADDPPPQPLRAVLRKDRPSPW